MFGFGSIIAIGSSRIPPFVIGLSVSVAAHVGLLATLAVLPSGGSHRPASIPPAPEFSWGEPIQVCIVSERAIDGPSPVVEMELPDIPSEADLSSAVAVMDEAKVTRDSEGHPVADEDKRHGKRIDVPWPGFDWKAFVESLRVMDRPAVIADSGDADRVGGNRKKAAHSPDSETANVATDQNEPQADEAPHAASAAPSDTDSPSRGAESADREAPRGIDRGAAVVCVPTPVYPRRCVRLKQEGTAIVEITVSADGAAEKFALRKSSGHELLDRAAIEAARGATFRPAFQDGRPVTAVIILPFEFRLKTAR